MRTPIGANCVLAQARSSSPGSIKHNKYLAALRRDLDAEAGAAAVPVDNVLCMCRKRIDRTFGQLQSRHGEIRWRGAVLPRAQIGSLERE